MKPAVFHPIWNWFFDECLPEYVKNHYSPNESWKSRPFTETDARFFLKGVRELSSYFTEDRDRFKPGYLNHGKFRSSYLLYFLPLQCAKFYLKMADKPQAIEAILKRGQEQNRLTIADIGAGPGTASIAFLLYVLAHHPKQLPEMIEFVWLDEAEGMMEDGAKLVEELEKHFRALEGRVKVRRVAGDWRRYRLQAEEKFDWLFFGNILNETNPNSPESRARFEMGMDKWMERSGIGGALFIEPAFRSSGQLLSQIRDHLLESETAPKIISPCLHSGRCPFSSGKDWCHFSVLAKVPGKWFIYLSKGLSAEREWLKYSHLWISYDPRMKLTTVAENERLVLTDSLIKNPKAPQLYLLCEPERAGRLSLSPSQPKLRRGDHYLLKAGQKIEASFGGKTRRRPRDDEFEDQDE